MNQVGLVSCVKSKRDEPAVPKNLYTSDYFKKMRSYAEQYHDDWWILSAKHGLLDPNGDAIEPCEETLSGARRAKKREWSKKVAEQLEEEGLLSDADTLVLDAGKDYYEELLPLIKDRGVEILIPTKSCISVKRKRGTKRESEG